MRRTGALVLATGLALAGLTACSGGDREYCDKIRDFDVESVSVDSLTEPSKMSEFASQYREIANVAPDDMQEHWTKLADATEQLGELMGANQDGEQDLEQLAQNADELQSVSSDLQQAFAAVSADIDERCS